jgi:hypothetical protein
MPALDDCNRHFFTHVLGSTAHAVAMAAAPAVAYVDAKLRWHTLPK